MRLRSILCFAAAIAASGAVRGYTLTGSHWSTPTVTMQLQLGSGSTTLTDGSTSWGASAEDALNVWNSVIAGTRFTVVRDSTMQRAQGNRVNNVFFSDSIAGEAWGSGVLAITLTYTSAGTQSTESDVLFNNTLKWDSYRGAQHYVNGSAVYDFHRVAIHEFGHVLGLDHPDQAGQTVVAVMNSHISNLDTVASDDIAGAQFLYGASAPVAVAAPVFTTQPASQSVATGGSVTFTVAVSSSAPVAYQWTKDGVGLSGATNTTLTLTGATSASAGNYRVTATNPGGSTASSAATLTVTTAVPSPNVPLSQLVNLSTRGYVPNGGALTAGFVLRGTADKNVLVRGVGPALNSFGVSGALSDPKLSVIAQDTAQVLAVNASWSQVPSLSTAFQNVGAFPLPAGSADSASQVRLTPGGYTTRITSNSSTTAGIALAEVYDANPTVTQTRLVNLSTLGIAGTGDSALTAGFTIQGTAVKRLLIRAVGPGLAKYNVTGTLADPRLTVYPLGKTNVVAANDDWTATADLQAAFAAAGAFNLVPGSRDAALVVTLPPGGYTVTVSGADASSGYVLLELYDLD